MRLPVARAMAPSGRLTQVGMVVFAFFLALFFGLASAFLPAWFVVSMLLVPTVLAMLLVRPEYALVACVALVCNLVHPAFVPRVPLFGGSLAAADAALLMLTLYAAWVAAAQARTAKLPPVPGARWLAVCCGLFALWLVLSVVLSLSLRGLKPGWVLGEARDLLYVLALPVAVVILRQRVRQERFVVGLVVVGCLFSVGQILQGVFHLPVFGTSGMSVLETLGYRDYSTTRSNTHGLSVIIFALLLVTGAYALDRIPRWLFLAAAGLLSAGIFLTFGRTTFAVVALCVFLVVRWLNPARLPQLALIALAALTLGAAAGSLWRPETVAAVYYRMTSISSELEYGYSAGWRVMEFKAMFPHILEHPLTGIGLGADYKGISGSSTNPELNRYVHNAYLYMAGKMGIPALLFFLGAMAATFAIGRRAARSDAAPWIRIVGAASAVMMVRFIAASMTEPHLMSDHGVVNIALAAALVTLAARRMGAAAPPGRPGSGAAPRPGPATGSRGVPAAGRLSRA